MYIKETMIAGNVIEVRKYFATRYGVHHAREKNAKKTEDKQRKVNERNAERRLRGLINANFGYNDLFLTLTYSGEAPNKDTAKRQLNSFIRKLRHRFKAITQEMKYISVTEVEAKRIHHHVILSGGLSLNEIQSIWNCGFVRAEAIQPDSDNSALAEYMIKETKRTFNHTDALFKKRWNASRNLIQPKITKEIIQARTWRDEPAAPRGYKVLRDTIREWFDCFGRPVQEYRMIKLPKCGSGRSGQKYAAAV